MSLLRLYKMKFHETQFCVNLDKLVIKYDCWSWDLMFDPMYVKSRFMELLSNWFIQYCTTMCKLIDLIAAHGLPGSRLTKT